MNNDDPRLDSDLRSRFRELGRLVDRTAPATRPVWQAKNVRVRSARSRGASFSVSRRVRMAESLGGGAAAVAVAVLLVATLVGRTSPVPGTTPGVSGPTASAIPETLSPQVVATMRIVSIVATVSSRCTSCNRDQRRCGRTRQQCPTIPSMNRLIDS